MDKPIETVYIQPESLLNLSTGVFTIGTGTQYYKLSPFAIGKYEVTFDEWRTTYDWAVKNGYTFEHTGECGSTGIKRGSYTAEQGRLPVIKVSWADSMVWCNARSEQEGLEPVYTFSDGSVVRDSESQDDDYNFLFMTAEYSHSKDGYRLPTKIEWQFAAQGGLEGRNVFFGSDSSTELLDYAWVYSNAAGKVQTVGTKKCNSLGLYDMSGNVDEWIWDWNTGTKVDSTTELVVDGVKSNVYVDPAGPLWSGSDAAYKFVMGGNVNCGNSSSSDTGERSLESCKVTYTQRGARASLYEEFGGFRICRTLGGDLS